MIVFNTMTLQMDAKAFAQSRFAEPRDLLIIFLILTNDSNEEIVSKKKKIWELAFESQLLRTLPCAEFDPIQIISYFQK